MLKDELNAMLSELSMLDNLYCGNPNLNDYSIPVIQASLTVGHILTDYVKSIKPEVNCDIPGIIIEKENNRSRSPFLYVEAEKLLPAECLNVLHRVRIFRNRSTHGDKISFDEYIAFSAALKCLIVFLLNIKNSYTETYLNELCRFNSIMSSIKNEIYNSKEKETILLEKMEKCLEKADEISGKFDKLDQKIDTIGSEILKISEHMNEFQSFMERNLDMLTDIKESNVSELIIKSYIDECAEKISRTILDKSNDDNADIVKENLISSMGESTWPKLNDDSKDFLVSSKLIYNSSINNKNIIDYSGVCLLMTKALELELSDRFCKRYITYLKEKYPGKSNLNKFPDVLLNQYKNRVINSKHFTIGSVAYVLGYLYTSEEQRDKNIERMKEFCADVLMPKDEPDVAIEKLHEFAEQIEIARKDYRNPSAHTNRLRKIEAKECMDLILDVEKLLKRMLDSFAI